MHFICPLLKVQRAGKPSTRPENMTEAKLKLKHWQISRLLLLFCSYSYSALLVHVHFTPSSTFPANYLCLMFNAVYMSCPCCIYK